ncbi:MAG: RDD family protein [Gammaproteobacteria bacterium]|nr:RDD family protein [Gammaproteobacteria bacterium]
MRPAGFARRCAAWSLDAALVALPVLALAWRHLRLAGTAVAEAWEVLATAAAQAMATTLAAAADTGGAPGPDLLAGLARAALRDPALREASRAMQSALVHFAGPPAACFLLLFLAWCVGFERSPLRATPGKRALGLRVADAAGKPAGTGRLLLRFLGGSLSWLSLNLGHLLAAVGPEHAALHDRISGTRVLLDDGVPPAPPPWARAWLALQAVAVLAATAWASLALGAAMQAALDRALWG